MKKILVVQTAFIGDVILATSMAETIHRVDPEARIDFLVRNGNEGLLANNPLISNVLIWNKKQKFKSLLKNILKVRKERYDAVINIQRFMNSGLITGLSKAKKRVGFTQNPASFLFTQKVEHQIPDITLEGQALHEVQRNAKLLRSLYPQLDAKDAASPKLYFNQDIEEKILGYTDSPYIVLAPTSVWFTKQWAFEKWRELSATLSENFKLYFIGAPDDRQAIDSIIGKTENCENLAGKLSLLESARLMKNAARVFVNDSAPLHLASSVNAKTTAIFCSTVPEFGYTPLSEDHAIITRRPRLECQPCGLHGRKACPLGHFRCALEIPVAEVASTVENALGELYHIATEEDLIVAKKDGFYSCASLRTEGFIHLSFEGQIKEAGEKYYRGKENLKLLKLSRNKLEDLRVENGYPHLYQTLPLEAIISQEKIAFN